MQHFPLRCTMTDAILASSGYLRPLVRASRARQPSERTVPMTEATTVKPKPAKAAAPVVQLFEMPKFDIPNFEMPKMEIPAAFREFAEKGVAQTKDAYEKFKTVAEENTTMLETVYTTASKGSTEYGLKVLEVARANTGAMFDYVEALFGVKSPSEFVELSTKHARGHCETLNGHGKDMVDGAPRGASEATAQLESSYR